MRLAELIGLRVLDADGRDIGSVRDVRFRHVTGPVVSADGVGRLVLEELVLGNVSLGLRLGYVQSEVTGPLLLRWLFDRLARRAHVVDWRDVVEKGPTHIRIRRRGGELMTLLEGVERNQGRQP